MKKNNDTVTQKIRDDWGTLTHFCKKHDINIHTFKQVIYGFGTSSRIESILVENGYIKNINDLKKAS